MTVIITIIIHSFAFLGPGQWIRLCCHCSMNTIALLSPSLGQYLGGWCLWSLRLPHLKNGFGNRLSQFGRCAWQKQHQLLNSYFWLCPRNLVKHQIRDCAAVEWKTTWPVCLQYADVWPHTSPVQDCIDAFACCRFESLLLHVIIVVVTCCFAWPLLQWNITCQLHFFSAT